MVARVPFRMGVEDRPWLLRGAILAIAVVVGVLAWLATREDGEEAASTAVPARVVSAEELADVAAAAGHPVYWAGAMPGTELEVTQEAGGNVVVRYLTGAAEAASPRGDFLTVGTYPLADAAAALDNVASAPGAIVRLAPDGRRLVSSGANPTSVYFAGPDNSVQVEIYDPSPQRAMRLALSPRVTPVPAGR